MANTTKNQQIFFNNLVKLNGGDANFLGGDIDTFNENMKLVMSSDENKKKFYENMTKKGINLGDYDTYLKNISIVYPTDLSAQANATQPAGQTILEPPAGSNVSVDPNVDRLVQQADSAQAAQQQAAQQQPIAQNQNDKINKFNQTYGNYIDEWEKNYQQLEKDIAMAERNGNAAKNPEFYQQLKKDRDKLWNRIITYDPTTPRNKFKEAERALANSKYKDLSNHELNDKIFWVKESIKTNVNHGAGGRFDGSSSPKRKNFYKEKDEKLLKELEAERNNRVEYEKGLIRNGATDLKKKLAECENKNGVSANTIFAGQLNRKTKELSNAGSKYDESLGIVNWAEGAGNKLADSDTWSLDINELVRLGGLTKVVYKLNSGEQLAEDEQLLLEAFINYGIAQEMRADDLSLGYQIGQATVECGVFMAELLLTAGVGAGAKKVIFKGLKKAGYEELAEKVAKYMGGVVIEEKIGTDLTGKAITKTVEHGATKTMKGKAARELGEVYLQTTAMPTTWSRVEEGKLQKFMNGEDYHFNDFLFDFQGAVVENFTEKIGGKAIDKLLSKAIPLDRIWGHRVAGKSVTNNIVQSYFGEGGEEYEGATINLVRSLAPWYDDEQKKQLRDEFGEMFTAEGAAKVFGTMAPMSTITGGVNIANIATSTRNMKSARNRMIEMMKNQGATDEQAQMIIKSVEGSANGKEFIGKIGEIARKMQMDLVSNNPTTDPAALQQLIDAQTEVFDNYLRSAIRYNESVNSLNAALEKLTPEQQAEIKQNYENYVAAQRERFQQDPAAQEIENFESEVNSRANLSNGNVQEVQIEEDENSTYFVRSGNLQFTTDQDGNLVVDRANSDKMVVIVGADGKAQQVSVDVITKVVSNQSAEQAVQEGTQQIRQAQSNAQQFPIGSIVYNTAAPSQFSAVQAVDGNGFAINAVDEQGNSIAQTIDNATAQQFATLELHEGQTLQTNNGTIAINRIQADGNFQVQAADGTQATLTPQDFADLLQETGYKPETKTQEQGEQTESEQAEQTQSEQSNDSQASEQQEQSIENISNDQTNEQEIAEKEYKEFENTLPRNKKGEIDTQNLSFEQQTRYFEHELGKEWWTNAVKNARNTKLKELAKAQKALQTTADFTKAAKLQRTINALQADVKQYDQYLQQATAEQQAAEQAERQKQAEKRAANRQTEIAQAGHTPAERWNAAPKHVGNQTAMTLPDGTELKGHFVLTEAGAATPSHDPNNNWNTSEGFPTTEDGRNINDRDYHNDQAAQQHTIGIAQTYNGQALTELPVVNADGIVLSGNGRTIAGNIAAQNNTDQAYIESLNSRLEQFGFTAEQVAGMQHPRVYFQTETELPLNTTTFAKFNGQNMKTQNSTARAISNSKKLTDTAREMILSEIGQYSSLDSFFASANATKNVLKALLDFGIISQAEIAELTDGNVFSTIGKEFVTDLVIGSLFDEKTITLLGGNKALKQSLLRAALPIIENSLLGEYSLSEEINNAIRLINQAKQSGFTLQEYLIAPDMFEGKVSDRYGEFEIMLATAMTEGVENFRQVLNRYNTLAKNEVGNTSSGNLFGTVTKEDVKNLVLEYYGQQKQSDTRNSGQETGDVSQSVRAGDVSRDGAVAEPQPKSLLDVVKTLYEKGKEHASKLFAMSHFDVAKTPDFMKKLGLTGDKFTIRYGVIARHLDKDGSHTLSEKDWEQLPQALQNPFAITQNTDRENAYRIYTTLKTESGEYVVVGVDVKNAGRDVEVNSISTVFGRRNNANLPLNEKVIFESKEITPEQSALLNEPNSRQYQTEQELSADKGSKNSGNEQTAKTKSFNDYFSEYIDSIVVQNAKFPKNADGVVNKKQKSGKRRDSVDVSIVLLGDNLHIKVKGNYGVEIVIPNARQYGAVDICDRIDLGIGTSVDAARLINDAVLELWKNEHLSINSLFKLKQETTKPQTTNEQTLTDRLKAAAEKAKAEKAAKAEQVASDIKKWLTQFGTNANDIHIITDLDQLPASQRAVREYIEKGGNVMAWVQGGVYLYLPNIMELTDNNVAQSVEKAKAKVFHEMLAHKHLKEWLGDKKWNALMDSVWNMMSPEQRRAFIRYQYDYNLKQQQGAFDRLSAAEQLRLLNDVNMQRGAADEFTAHFAERVAKNILAKEEQTVWEKILAAFRAALEKIGLTEFTEQDLENILLATYVHAKKSGTEAKAEQARQAAKQQEQNKGKSFDDYLAQFSPMQQGRIKKILNKENESLIRKAFENGDKIEISVLYNSTGKYNVYYGVSNFRITKTEYDYAIWLGMESNRSLEEAKAYADYRNAVNKVMGGNFVVTDKKYNDFKALIKGIEKQIKNGIGRKVELEEDLKNYKAIVDYIDKYETDNQGNRLDEENHNHFSIEETNEQQPFHAMIDDLFTNENADKSKYQRTYFHVASTPAFMNEIGLKGAEFTIPFKAISTHLGKDGDHRMTAADWHKLPEALQNPFLITKYKGENDRFRIYVNMNIDGKFVAVGVDVKRVNQGKGKPMVEINSIKTVFAKSGQIGVEEEIVCYDKNITPEQQTLLGGHNFRQYSTIQELTAKVIKNFENPSVESGNISFSVEERRQKIADNFGDIRFSVIQDIKDGTTHNLAKKYWNDGLAKVVNDAKGIDDINEALSSLADGYVARYTEKRAVVNPKRARNQIANLQDSDPTTMRTILGKYNIAYRADVEKYKDEEVKTLIAPIEEILTDNRIKVGTEWNNALKGYLPAERYLVMRSLCQFIKKETEACPISFFRQPFETTMAKFAQSNNPSQFNFYSEYNNAIFDMINDDPSAVVDVESENGVSGRWLKMSKASESKDEKLTRAKVAAASQGTQWCTKYENQSGTGALRVITEDDHDFYVFIPKGSSTAAMAIVPVKENEKEQLQNNTWYTGIFKRSNGSGNQIDPNFYDAVNGLARQSKDQDLVRTLDWLGYNGMTKEELAELQRQKHAKQIEWLQGRERFTADDIVDIQNLFGIQLHTNGDELVMHEFNNGVYEQVADVIRDDFWEKMFRSIDVIERDANFCNNQITSLGNLQSIGGIAYFCDSQVTDLGNLQSIGGDAYFCDSQVTSLGNLQSIGGDADFSDSQVTDLGNLKKIVGNAYFCGSQVTDLGNLKKIVGNACFGGSQVTSLGNLREIYGDARFINSQVTDLGNLQSIGCDAYFDNSQQQLREQWEERSGGGTRFSVEFSDNAQSFNELQRRAVAERGIVTPNLASKSVELVKINKHNFVGDNPIALAKQWAKSNLIGEHTLSNGNTYAISKTAIDKYLSETATKNSENLGVHLSTLTELPKVIDKSIDVEIHADYKKGADGKRSAENGVGNSDLLVHRLYGAVTIDGTTYRVKTTMHEFSPIREEKSSPHSYEVTKIEVIEKSTTSVGAQDPNSTNEGLTIGTAKLLKNVEKSYDNGKKVLDESKNVSFSVEQPIEQRGNLIALHNIKESELAKSLEFGGLPMPSIAVTNTEIGHTDFGDISLVFGKNTIDPSNSQNKVYTGDAWTPTFPHIESKISEKKLIEIEKEIKTLLGADYNNIKYLYSLMLDEANVSDKINRGIENSFAEAYKNNTAIKIAFLKHKGLTFKPALKDYVYNSKYDGNETLRRIINEVGNGSAEVLYNLNFDEKMALEPAIRKIINQYQEKLLNEALQREKEGNNGEKKLAFLKKIYRIDEQLSFSDIDSLLYDAYRLERYGEKKEIDKRQTEQKVNDRFTKKLTQEYEQWLNELSDGIIEKRGIRNETDTFTRSGNRRSWESLYDSVTLYNIVKAMKSQEPTGGNTFGANIFGSAHKEVGSLDELRELATERMKMASQEEIEQLKKDITDRLFEVADKVITNDKFGAALDFQSDFADTVRRFKTASGIYKDLHPYYKKLTIEHAKELADIIKDIQKIPIKYFEAKPRRAVSFNEIKLAVVPKGTDQKIINQLTEKGVLVKTYKKGDNESRKKVLNTGVKNGGLRFSVDDAPFYSNAERAVESVKQDKATPQQWLAMLEKQGGLKAGEDKWLGLSDYLKASNEKSLTKQQVLEYINANKIELQEMDFAEEPNIDKFQKEFQAYIEQAKKEQPKLSDFDYSEIAFDNMIEDYGEDFGIAFGHDYNGKLVIDNNNAAEAYGVESRAINNTRLDYTTKGLTDKREIAMYVPTIESWDEHDEIHFGQDTDGKAIAWARFGETTDSEGNRVLVIDEIQSNRHQEGREKGYSKKKELKAKYDKLVVKLNELQDAKDDFREKHPKETRTKEQNEYFDKLREEFNRLDEEKDELHEQIQQTQGNIPTAPFEKNWHELAFKRMLYYAAENGFDKVAWTTGTQQVKRYGLEDNSGMGVFYDQILPRFADKYCKKWGTHTHNINLPHVEKDGQTMHAIDVTAPMRESVSQGQPMFSVEERPTQRTTPEAKKWKVSDRLAAEMAEIKAKAEQDGTFMLAPNGKKSNLNERNWLLVRTKEFKKWFGDWENDPANSSKVVDKNGEPLVVYHNTDHNFTIFDTQKIGENSGDYGYFGKGFYLTGRHNFGKGFGGNKMELFLNLKNPLIPDKMDGSEVVDFLEYLKRESEGKEFVTEIDVFGETDNKDAITKYDFENNAYGLFHNGHLQEYSEIISDYAKREGYDGVISDESDTPVELVAFSPNQIKSATENESVTNEAKDIRFSVEPAVQAEFDKLSEQQQKQVMQNVAKRKQSLASAERFIANTLENGAKGRMFEIELPSDTRRLIRREMGRDFDTHNIWENGIIHAYKNHGENGNKLTETSIPLTKSDFALVPHIMLAPDMVKVGSMANSRESVKFIKRISNGELVVVEKEFVDSADDLETINFWGDYSEGKTSSNDVDNRNPRQNVQNAPVSSDDVAKIRQNSELAIQRDEIRKIKFSVENSGIRFSISEKNRTKYETQIRKHNKNISDEQLKTSLDFLDELEDNKQNTKAIKIAVKWLANGTIMLPYSMENVRNAIALCEKNGIDPMQFKDPMEIINKYYVDVEYGKAVNPDEVEAFTNKRTIETENGDQVVIYDVDDSEDGQAAVCAICHQHFGYSTKSNGSKQPWCLASFTRQGEPTTSAKNYWSNTYTSVGKKIAFMDGKPIAFMAHNNDYDGDLWWNLNDSSSNNLPLPNGDYIMPDGEITDIKGGDSDDSLDEFYNDAVNNIARDIDSEHFEDILRLLYGKCIYDGEKMFNSQGLFEDTQDEIYQYQKDELEEYVRGIIEEENQDSDIVEELNDRIQKFVEENELEESDVISESDIDDIKEELIEHVLDNYYDYNGLEDLWYEYEDDGFRKYLYDYDWEVWQKADIIKDYTQQFYDVSDDAFDLGQEIREEQQRLSGSDYQDLHFSIEETNATFNEQLQQFNEQTADKTIFDLGIPSDVLLSAGIRNLPMRLYGSKVLAKMKKHGFDANDLKDLPQAIANPIAVFKGSIPDSRAILTELKIGENNVLVSVAVGKGNDVDFNIISSTYGKAQEGIVKWINNGKLLYANKEKTLNYLHLSAPIAEASNNQELNSAAKVVQNFENAKFSVENLTEKPTLGENESLSDYFARYNAWRNTRNEPLQRTFAAGTGRNRTRSQRFNEQMFDERKELERFQQRIVENGGTLTEASDAYNEFYQASGRASHFKDFYKRVIMKRLAGMIGKIESNGWLNDFKLVWRNIDEIDTPKSEQRNGKRLTIREIMGVYAQAKDVLEAEQLGLPARGRSGFENNLGLSPEQLIEKVESLLPTSTTHNFWSRVNEATQYALGYQLQSGLISQETFEKYQNRKFYVPERGWRERGESDNYNKRAGKFNGGAYNAALIRAKGRESLAADPFGYIESIAESAITMGEKNKAKLKFLQLCLDNETLGVNSGMFAIKKIWGENVKDADGTTHVVIRYGEPTAEQREHDEALKAKIETLQKRLAGITGNVARGVIESQIETLQSQLIIADVITNDMIENRTKDERLQHEVVVMKNGTRYIIQLFDEHLANIVNENLHNYANNDFDRVAQKATRFMSSVLTQFNPEFAARNFVKDLAMATISNLADQSAGFQVRFLGNIMMCQKALNAYIATDRFGEQGKYIDSTYGKYLQEFFEQGAATGWSFLNDINALNEQFDSLIKDGSVSSKAWEHAKGALSYLTELSELTIRFAEYATARQMGQSAFEAAKLAKEISVNFDRKAKLAHTPLGKYWSFFNATLQGVNKISRNFKEHWAMYGIAAPAAFLAIGLLATLLNPDDPDDETKFSDFERMANLCFGNRVKIPVVHFFAMFNAAGVNIALAMQGRKSWEHALYDTAMFAVGELLPDSPLQAPLQSLTWNETKHKGRGGVDFDIKGGLRSVMPTALTSVADVALNRDFRGQPIYKEPYVRSQDGKVKNLHQGFESTPEGYKWIARRLNELTGGNPNIKSTADGGIDLNPTLMQYSVRSTTGGLGEFVIGFSDLIEKAANENEEVTMHDVPFARKFVKAPYDVNRAYKDEFYKLRERVRAYDSYLDELQDNDREAYRDEKKSDLYKVYRKTRKYDGNPDETPDKSLVDELMKANRMWNRAKAE